MRRSSAAAAAAAAAHHTDAEQWLSGGVDRGGKIQRAHECTAPAEFQAKNADTVKCHLHRIYK